MANENQAQSLQRPQRKDFQVKVVLAPNGQIVDPQDWQKALGDKQGKERRQVLREHGWKETSTFNQEEYEAAVKQFREESRNMQTNSRKDLFTRVFDEAAVDRHPRLEATLRTILPALNTENSRRVEKALVNICAAVDGLLKPVPQRGAGRRGRKQDAEQKQEAQANGNGHDQNDDDDTKGEGNFIPNKNNNAGNDARA